MGAAGGFNKGETPQKKQNMTPRSKQPPPKKCGEAGRMCGFARKKSKAKVAASQRGGGGKGAQRQTTKTRWDRVHRCVAKQYPVVVVPECRKKRTQPTQGGGKVSNGFPTKRVGYCGAQCV